MQKASLPLRPIVFLCLVAEYIGDASLDCYRSRRGQFLHAGRVVALAALSFLAVSFVGLPLVTRSIP